jgi:hypothetical protein
MSNIKLLALVIPASFFLSCSSNKSGENMTGNDVLDTTAVADTTPINELANYKFSYTIANLPSPLEVLEEFSTSGFAVNTELLNKPENVDNYHTSLKQAFNYGIYGVDLAYAVVNNRAPDIIKYYACSKKLAEQLNLGESFNKFVNRFEVNANNKDSLKRVVDQAYASTDSYLRSNERLKTASQILAGSWIEGQHLTVNLLKDAERSEQNEKLYERVWEQRLYLENISGIFNEFKDDAELSKIKKDMDTLLELYKEPKEAKDINKDLLVRLSNNLARIRNSIIK